MDMWNWLHDCYGEGSLTLEDLEAALTDDQVAKNLWDDWVADSEDFIEIVRDEIYPFIDYIKRI